MSRSNDKNEYISTQFRSETRFFFLSCKLPVSYHCFEMKETFSIHTSHKVNLTGIDDYCRANRAYFETRHGTMLVEELL